MTTPVPSSPSLRAWGARGFLAALVLVVCAALPCGPAAAQTSATPLLAAGIAQREQGQLLLSINTLRAARDAAPNQAEALRASAELGASLLQARRLDAAQEALEPAYDFFSGVGRARVAIDLGNLAVLRGGAGTAQRYYTEALRQGGGDAEIRFAVGMNQARMSSAADQPAQFAALASALATEPAGAAKARWQINLAQQLRKSGAGPLAQAHALLADAQRWATQAGPGQGRLQAEAGDGLAQLYEDQSRAAESLVLTRQALATVAAMPAGTADDLAIQLEWRQARLTRTLGRAPESLDAYERAVRRLEALRQDLPIEDEAGVSSFRSTLQPVYLGLVSALLDAADAAPLAQQAAYLRRSIDTVELIRQSELQDYLGDRCEVDAVKGGSATVIPHGTAVLYPVVLADRLELLLETDGGITRVRSPAPAARVAAVATAFAAELREGTPGFMAPARQLYDWVLRPLEPALAQQGVRTLVVAPDGALRLVAIGAFHDGERFAIEKFAFATATGMTMTNTTPPASPTAPMAQAGALLVAGMSEPGPVVDKLSAATVARLLGTDASASPAPQSLVASRSVRSLGLRALPGTRSALSLDAAGRTRALREALALPGVNQELAAIQGTVPGRELLNASFTVDRFRRAAESGDYRIIHVASHGVFGGSADASYILAYDDLLTLDGLQTLLRSDEFRRNPIELLSLSACETAEGDDRSPLGISGAAMKARAKAVMGSLWPVADEAAVPLMAGFYRRLGLGGSERLSKAEALQQAQMALLHNPDYAHPFFWAPFILIGNWL
ncbi:MAG: hypothetical protein JWP29_4071 [Rhodoferax sp.]|nr:hypothetical protein [Rhodoferax sp.]